MALISSFFVPHSPLLMPTIGKGHLSMLNDTKKAYKTIHEYLKRESIDTVIVFSAHTNIETKTFNVNLAKEYKTDLKEFGDLITKTSWYPDVALIGELRSSAEHTYDVNLITNESLDYGTTIPLEVLFGSEKNKPNIVPITFAKIPLLEVYRFGQFLHNELCEYPKNVTILATGDLSHKLSHSSPTGFSPKAKAFDNQLIRSVKQKNVFSLTKLSQKTLDHVGQCGLRSLVLLSAIFSSRAYTPIVLSYEHPMGIGYCTAAYILDKK